MLRRTGRTLVSFLCLCASAPAATAAAQCPDGTPPPCAQRAARAAPPTSVAVLYFENLSRDTADLYLAEGLTEELTSRLGDIERLRVSGKSAVRRAQRSYGDDLAAIGRSLGVRYLVEGSLRHAGDEVRITARLLRASDGVRVWGDSYDRSVGDILALQSDIAQQVVSNVAGRLLPADRVALAARPTTNPAAYVHYLRGSWLFGRRSAPGALQAAAAEFDEALRIDPSFTGAMARRAYVLILALGYGADWAPADSLARWSRVAAERAVRMDSLSSDAWMALGDVRTFVDKDILGGLVLLRRATTLDPRNVEAVHALGVNLAWGGQDSAAAVYLRRALALDQGRAVTMLDLGEVALLAHRDAEALALVDSANAIDPQQARPYLVRARLRLANGSYDAARADALEGRRLATRGLRAQAQTLVVAAEAAAGDTAAARRAAAALDSLDATPVDRARARVALGDRDGAITVLEQAAPDVLSWYALRWPEFDGLRRDPRFVRVFEAWRPKPVAAP